MEIFGVGISPLTRKSPTQAANHESQVISLPATEAGIHTANDTLPMPHEGICSEQYLQAKSIELMCLITELAHTSALELREYNALPRNKSATLIKLMRALEDSHFLSLTLGEIACELGICKISLSNVFKEGYGMKLSDYFLQRRMELARKLLREGRLSALEVALEVGYQNQSSFGRAYRQYYDRTPSQDRRLQA